MVEGRTDRPASFGPGNLAMGLKVTNVKGQREAFFIALGMVDLGKYPSQYGICSIGRAR